VTKISSPGSIVDMPYLCNNRSQWAGNMGEAESRSGLASESKRSQISQKDFAGEMPELLGVN